MALAQAHRGPDGTAVVTSTDGQSTMAMNTLRIFDRTAPIGPYQDTLSGIVLALNGEIYNWRELSARWGINLAPGESDAHLLLRAWTVWGPKVVSELDGMFAIAVYDPGRGQLVLARDRLGEKPMYWRLDGGRIAFASEIRALLRYGPAPICVRSEMVSIETPVGRDTPYQGIQSLSPGHVLTFDVSTVSVRQDSYWDLANVRTRDPVALSYRDAENGLVDILCEDIPLRVPKEPYALLLSGGLDSGLLAYLMKPPVCVTVRYPGLDRLDEYEAAARVARDIGAELVLVEPNLEQFQADLQDVVDSLDYPMGNAATYSEYAAVRAVAARGLRVVVGGLGPDEFLLGYARHALALFGADAARTTSLNAYQSLARRLHEGGPCGNRVDAYTSLVLRGPDPSGKVKALIQRCFDAAGEQGRALTLSDLATSWRPQVLTSDKLSSAFGLERRSPFLSRRFVEFCYSMPLAYKMPEPGVGKALLRSAARHLGLPRRIYAGNDKLGFSSAVPQWLAGELAEWCDAQLEAARRHAPSDVRAMLDPQPPADNPYSRQRMLALMIAIWSDGALAPSR